MLVYDRKRGQKKNKRSVPPQKIVDEVCNFNSTLWRKRIVNKRYFTFLHDLLDIESSAQNEAVRVGVRVLFGTELKEISVDAETHWFNLLSKILESSKSACEEMAKLLLNGSTQLIRELLIHGRDKTVRYHKNISCITISYHSNIDTGTIRSGTDVTCHVKNLNEGGEDTSKLSCESLDELLKLHDDVDDKKCSISFRIAKRAWLVCMEEQFHTLSHCTLRHALNIVSVYKGNLLTKETVPVLLKIFEMYVLYE